MRANGKKETELFWQKTRGENKKKRQEIQEYLVYEIKQRCCQKTCIMGPLKGVIRTRVLYDILHCLQKQKSLFFHDMKNPILDTLKRKICKRLKSFSVKIYS